ncbi:unnamed protein product, partial [Adineta steineri]
MSNNTIQEKTRAKSLADSSFKMIVVNGKRRRLCSVENCEKQSQRKGLCARHLTESKNLQQSLENSEILNHNAANSFLLTNNHTTQNISNQYGNTSSTTIHTSQIESTIIPCSMSEQTQYASAHTTDQPRSSITIVPSKLAAEMYSILGVSTVMLYENQDKQNNMINTSMCEHRYLLTTDCCCQNVATYRCMHCCSSFCLKHGMQHQQHLKEELQTLFNEAQIPELTIDSGRPICMTQLNQWAQMMHDTIDQKYNELRNELGQKHDQIERNKNSLTTFMRNELEQNVGCVLKEQLEKDEIDEPKVDEVRKEFHRLQQLFYSLNTKPLISLSNVDVNQVDLDTYGLVLPKITMTDCDWMTNLCTENTEEIMESSDEEQTDTDETDTSREEMQIFTTLVPSGYRNHKLEQSIINQKDSSGLYLPDWKLNAEDIKIIIHYVLQNNTTLTALHLEFNKIGAKGAKHLSNALKSNEALTTLDLSSNVIGDEGVKHLSNALKSNETLTALDLSSNVIGDEGVKHLSNALQVNKALTTLDLSSNVIEDEGVKHLSNALQVNKALTTLDLSSNVIEDEGVKHLSNALQVNK